MSQADRWRLWIRLFGGSMALGAAAMAVAVATRSAVGVVVALGSVAVGMAVLVGGKVYSLRHPGFLVPPHLQGLDPDGRRLVAQAVAGGARVATPALAGAAARHARVERMAASALLASAAVGLYLRIASLASGDASVTFDVLGAAFWLAGAASTLVRLARARRALSVNSSG